MKKQKIAIDLLWVRPEKVGGTEFYIRNILDGLCEIKETFHFALLVSKDNAETFRKYAEDKRFHLIIAEVCSANISKRIIWQNLFQNSLLRKNGITCCFVPVYCRPVFNGGIIYINTIHDLQAAHYPEYHPFHEVAYTKMCWWLDVHKSKKIIATSCFVKKDILSYYKLPADKVSVIYIPIKIDIENTCNFSKLAEKWEIEEKQYYYTVAQMIPHKNLKTLVKVIKEIKAHASDLPCKLLISGINGNAAEDIKKQIAGEQLQNHIILTGFINNTERNTLYKNCRAFLFPSVFEGFGMPPIEAMGYGAPVITTKCASIPEITQGLATYVDDPYDVQNWIEKIRGAVNHSAELDLSRYDKICLSQKILNYLKEI